jgi:hypothetical protein
MGAGRSDCFGTIASVRCRGEWKNQCGIAGGPAWAVSCERASPKGLAGFEQQQAQGNADKEGGSHVAWPVCPRVHARPSHQRRQQQPSRPPQKAPKYHSEQRGIEHMRRGKGAAYGLVWPGRPGAAHLHRMGQRKNSRPDPRNIHAADTLQRLMWPGALGQFFEWLGDAGFVDADSHDADQNACSAPVPLLPYEKGGPQNQKGRPELHAGEGSQKPVQKRMGPPLVEKKKKMLVHLSRGRVLTL